VLAGSVAISVLFSLCLLQLDLLRLCGLEHLDRIAIGILQLDLPAGWAGFHLVAEMEAGLLHRGHTPRKIGDMKHHTVPPTQFLTLPIRHRPRAGGLGPAEQETCVAQLTATRRRPLSRIARQMKSLLPPEQKQKHEQHRIDDQGRAILRKASPSGYEQIAEHNDMPGGQYQNRER
jgi:hypothetical protein